MGDTEAQWCRTGKCKIFKHWSTMLCMLMKWKKSCFGLSGIANLTGLARGTLFRTSLLSALSFKVRQKIPSFPSKFRYIDCKSIYVLHILWCIAHPPCFCINRHFYQWSRMGMWRIELLYFQKIFKENWVSESYILHFRDCVKGDLRYNLMCGINSNLHIHMHMNKLCNWRCIS